MFIFIAALDEVLFVRNELHAKSVGCLVKSTKADHLVLMQDLVDIQT